MRNNALDLFKLIACMFVISLHVAGYPEMKVWFVNNLNLISRWAVPFFFVASGYHLSKKDRCGVLVKINKTSIIIAASCLLYMLFILVKSKFSIISMLNEGLSIRFYLSGSYGHLWFLFSLVYGCIIASFFIDGNESRKPIIIAAFILLLSWALDVANSVGDKIEAFYVVREVVSFPLMWIGYLIAKKNHRISFKASISIIIISMIMTVMEVNVLHKLFGFSIYERQLPLFCMPMAYGVFMLCLSMKTKNNWLSSIGRDYSLGIYIVHPMWVYFFYYTLPSSYQTPSTIVIPLVLIASVLSLMFMKRYMNRAFRLMNGM